MRTVGIKELKEKTAEILREVREQGASYEITYRGEVVASLVPAGKAVMERLLESVPKFTSSEEYWAAFDALGKQIESQIPPHMKHLSSVDIMRMERGKLEGEPDLDEMRRQGETREPSN